MLGLTGGASVAQPSLDFLSPLIGPMQDTTQPSLDTLLREVPSPTSKKNPFSHFPRTAQDPLDLLQLGVIPHA